MTETTFNRIAEFIVNSDFPRKQAKLADLRRAYRRGHPLTLAGDTILLGGIAIDPLELENGYWL